MDLRNKKVTVVGLGNSGIGSARLLFREGAIVSVTEKALTDDVRTNAKFMEKHYIDLEIGRHTELFLKGTELLVVSPGAESSSLPIRYAERNKIPVISELELGYLFCREKIVAVTGTNGKSTVVSLLGEILRCAGMSAKVCGNIGNCFSGEIKNIRKNTAVLLEASSFQLERIKSFRPHISIILNIAEDHMDRYVSFKDYRAAKARIFKNQGSGDFTILNCDDENSASLAKAAGVGAKLFYFSRRKRVKGIYCDKSEVKLFLKASPKKLFRLPGSRLRGDHNVENILAATLAANLLGVGVRPIEEAIRNFEPLKHRFEKIAVIGGIEFIDDSKATNIDSVFRALESMDKNVILIAGGKDKNLSYEKIMPAIKKHVKKIVLIGETRRKMRDAFEEFTDIEESDSLEEAVKIAYKNAVHGDSVLLSPMSSSFDMFRSYKERGDAFRAVVEKLKLKGKKF